MMDLQQVVCFIGFFCKIYQRKSSMVLVKLITIQLLSEQNKFMGFIYTCHPKNKWCQSTKLKISSVGVMSQQSLMYMLLLLFPLMQYIFLCFKINVEVLFFGSFLLQAQVFQLVLLSVDNVSQVRQYLDGLSYLRLEQEVVQEDQLPNIWYLHLQQHLHPLQCHLHQDPCIRGSTIIGYLHITCHPRQDLSLWDTNLPRIH